MLNNEIFTSPEKCISECDKQIEFAKNLINYLEQYMKQLEIIKSMANSAKTFHDSSPYNIMMQFMEQFNKKPEDNK